MLRTAPELFQAFELHIRKPSFVAGNNRRYTMRIFEQLGLPNDVYNEIVATFADCEAAMNIGAWTGPKEEVSAEQLTGRETTNFRQEMRARGDLVSALMRKTAELEAAKRWGFKILGDIIYADIYAAVWPKAVFILLVRDPRDHALSVLKLNEQRLERGQQLFYPDYAAVARGWRETIDHGRRCLADNRLAHVVIRYEDLVRQPEKTMAVLGRELDLDLSNAARFHEHSFIESHTQRFKHHDNLRNPINADSVGKWKTKLTKADNAVFHDIAGDVMLDFDYTDR